MVAQAEQAGACSPGIRDLEPVSRKQNLVKLDLGGDSRAREAAAKSIGEQPRLGCPEQTPPGLRCE